MVILRTETPKYVEGEGAVTDSLTKIAKGISHQLHLTEVVTDEQVALEEAELGVKVQSASLAVAQELLLDAEPCAVRHAALFTNGVLELNYERAKQPGKHNEIHPSPRQDVRARDIKEDMISKSTALEGEQHKVMPPIVLVGQSQGPLAPRNKWFGHPQHGVEESDGGSLQSGWMSSSTPMSANEAGWHEPKQRLLRTRGPGRRREPRRQSPRRQWQCRW